MKKISALAGLLALGLASAAGAARLAIDRASLVRDTPAVIRVVPDSVDVVVREFFADSSAGASETVREARDPSGWTLYVEYFPNSSVVRDDSIGSTGIDGTVTWKPVFAGIVSVKARRGDEVLATNVSVKFPSMPVGAVLVFAVAGTILFGGAGWSIVHLMEHKPGERREEGTGSP